MKPPCSTPRPARKTRPGSRTTAPTGPRGTQDQPLHPPPLGRPKSPVPRKARILTDVLTRASAINLARLATLGLHHAPTGWAIA